MKNLNKESYNEMKNLNKKNYNERLLKPIKNISNLIDYMNKIEKIPIYFVGKNKTINSLSLLGQNRKEIVQVILSIINFYIENNEIKFEELIKQIKAYKELLNDNEHKKNIKKIIEKNMSKTGILKDNLINKLNEINFVKKLIKIEPLIENIYNQIKNKNSDTYKKNLAKFKDIIDNNEKLILSTNFIKMIIDYDIESNKNKIKMETEIIKLKNNIKNNIENNIKKTITNDNNEESKKKVA